MARTTSTSPAAVEPSDHAEATTDSEAGAPTTTLDFDFHLDLDLAGLSSGNGQERRGVGTSREIDEFWGTGRVGRIARAFFDYPHAYADPMDRDADRPRGSIETLERRTDRNRDERAVVLHNRRLPGTRDIIDHLVVAPSGVWIIDVIGLPGRIAQRNGGSWLKQEPRLYVADVDRSSLLAAIDQKASAVERILEHVDVAAVSLDRAACFTAAEWPRLFAKPLRISDVWITWPGDLAEMIVADGPLDLAAIRTVGDHLNESLKPA